MRMGVSITLGMNQRYRSRGVWGLVIFAAIAGCQQHTKTDGSLESKTTGLKPAASGQNADAGKYLDLNKNGVCDPYENPSLPVDVRVANLISLMNVDEKTCQLATLYGYPRILMDDLPTPKWKNKIWKDGIANIDEHANGWKDKKATNPRQENNPNYWPASSHAECINTVQRWFIEQTRLGIPVDFTNEGIFGLASYKATSFPSHSGIGNTWDRELAAEEGRVIGEEGRALGYTNIYTPEMDVARDQRWGRNESSFGESAFLCAEMGVPMIEALQKQHVISTVKHFAVYSTPRGGREGSARTDPQMPAREVEDELIYPFKRAFLEGHALGTMSSYNDYDGVPISGSAHWLIDRLRHEMGFKGYVVSDSEAVEYLHSKHSTAATTKEAVFQAIEGGVNVRTNFTPPETYVLPLRELVKEGRVSTKTLDSRVADVLRIKFQLGLFDHPYVDPKRADEVVLNDDHQTVGLRAARESMVLLKNEGGALPLKKTIGKVLVVGPNADDPWSGKNRYGPNHPDVTTTLAAIKLKLGEAHVEYVKGCNFTDKNWPASEVLPEPMTEEEKNGINAAVQAAAGADAIIIVAGDSPQTIGESKSRTSLDLPGRQDNLIKAMVGTGKPVTLVLINGRPMTINYAAKHVPAIISASMPGAFGGTAIADVIFGDYNPGGKLTTTWPKTVGQIPMNFPTKPNAQWETDKAANVAGTLYDFGYGLSYTTFEYSNLKLSPATGGAYSTSGDVVAEFDVKNTGAVAGTEVAELYTRDVVSTVTTYEKELSGFDRVSLEPGESKHVKITIPNERLSLINRDWKRVVEPGEFKVMVGASSEDLRLKGSFTIPGAVPESTR